MWEVGNRGWGPDGQASPPGFFALSILTLGYLLNL